MLSFDSRTINHLLSDQFSSYFSEEYPIFYKNVFLKKTHLGPRRFYRNAIDTALIFNQARSVESIIAFIIKYQNSYVSSFLFQHNLVTIINKGIKFANLLNSKVFSYEFDFDEWPSLHNHEQTYLRPYNGSIFEIRKNYKKVFPE